ncbi:nuclear transport factor 2 family protein [Burkholderiaceae bacterium UC74_6]
MSRLVRWGAAALALTSIFPAQAVETDPALVQRIQALEASMSEAFNRCDLDKLASFYDPRLEFYHDAAGVTWSRDQFIANVRKNACGRFTRHMVPGTMEVWPLGKFGALYTGSYQACLVKEGRCAVQGRVVMIVQNQEGNWAITRVVSYDHQELPVPPAAAASR